MDSTSEELNVAQQKAAKHMNGPLLILAGAGAGKTRVIAHRILNLIQSGISPKEILAITFTNKAAQEMRERIHGLILGSAALSRPAFEPQGMPFVSTFHSLGLAIIKENYRLLGLKRLPIVYDRSDSLRTMKQALKDTGATEEFEPRMILSIASRSKGQGISVEEFARAADNPRERVIAAVWERYEALLRDEGALDFDDLLLRAATMLSTHESVRTYYQKRWSYLHIDEFQDTNAVQSSLTNLLVGPEKNICVVGDIDQTIYTWRGADIRNIMTFEKEYPGAEVVLLEENYRSTKTILAAANDIIAKNTYRVEKKMFTKNGDGAALSLYQAFNETDEALYVARTIDDLLQKKVAPREIAVLYRANFQSRAIEEALLGNNIPYQVLGLRFFERAEIKDALALLRAALYETAADIARIANVPPRGIGKTTLLALLSHKETSLRADARRKIGTFRALLSRINARAGEVSAISDLLHFTIVESGMERLYKEDHAEGQERLENLRELVALAHRYDELEFTEGLQKFLEDAALASDQDELKEERNAVRLMTVHASKGLEFKYVFITGLEEGLFPHASHDTESGHDAEEERRLMYVALTRAQKKIYLSFASVRTMYGLQSLCEPSQFLSDISEEFIAWEAPERLGRTIHLE